MYKLNKHLFDSGEVYNFVIWWNRTMYSKREESLGFGNNASNYNCHRQRIRVTSLPNKNIFAWTKFKAFAHDKIIMTQQLKFVLGREENIVGKGENVVYHPFLLFPQYFSKAFFSRGVESRDCVVKG